MSPSSWRHKQESIVYRTVNTPSRRRTTSMPIIRTIQLATTRLPRVEPAPDPRIPGNFSDTKVNRDNVDDDEPNYQIFRIIEKELDMLLFALDPHSAMCDFETDGMEKDGETSMHSSLPESWRLRFIKNSFTNGLR